MAEVGAWQGIRQHGLLSTTALLDLFEVRGQARDKIEKEHRPRIVELTHPRIGRAAVRDQIPMSDEGLRRALPALITPSEWYARLNGMVFFWLTEKRLLRLTSARAYREIEHEVLVLDTRAIVDALAASIWLCPINSGCTKPIPHPRDHNAFQRISQYNYSHWRSKRPRGERVVELCLDHGVSSIERFMVDGFVIRGDQRLRPLR